MWHCVVWWIGANSTEEPAAFICSVGAGEGVEAAVTYWGLSNRVCYITLQQWHTAPCPTEYATLHCSSDILHPVQQSMLHYTLTMMYWALASRVSYITVWKWHTGPCPTDYVTSHYSTDVLGFVQCSTLHYTCECDILCPLEQSTLHHTATVTYWGLSNKVHHNTLPRNKP